MNRLKMGHRDFFFFLYFKNSFFLFQLFLFILFLLDMSLTIDTTCISCTLIHHIIPFMHFFFLLQLAKDINKEARDHIPLIGGLDDEMEGTGNLLSNSLGRVRGLLGSNRSNRRIMCYIAGGMVMFVVFTYLIYSLAGSPEAQ